MMMSPTEAANQIQTILYRFEKGLTGEKRKAWFAMKKSERQQLAYMAWKTARES